MAKQVPPPLLAFSPLPPSHSVSSFLSLLELQPPGVVTVYIVKKHPRRKPRETEAETGLCLFAGVGEDGPVQRGWKGAEAGSWLGAWLFWTLMSADCSVLKLMIPFLVTH